MRCQDADVIIEALAAGDDSADPALAAHVRQCPRCAMRLEMARAIESLLATREVPQPPERFTASVISRLRRERWRAEQLIDAGFNVAVAMGLLLIAGGAAGLAWSLGLFGADSILPLVSEGANRVVQRLLPQAQTVAVAVVLLVSALGLWWWAEEASP